MLQQVSAASEGRVVDGLQLRSKSGSALGADSQLGAIPAEQAKRSQDHRRRVGAIEDPGTLSVGVTSRRRPSPLLALAALPRAHGGKPLRGTTRVLHQRLERVRRQHLLPSSAGEVCPCPPRGRLGTDSSMDGTRAQIGRTRRRAAARAANCDAGACPTTAAVALGLCRGTGWPDELHRKRSMAAGAQGQAAVGSLLRVAVRAAAIPCDAGSTLARRATTALPREATVPGDTRTADRA